MNTVELAKVAKALADPTRLRIYEKIAAQPDTICGELVESFGLSPATISHHIKVLSDAGLIETRREGQFVHNCPVRETINQFREALGKLGHSSTDRKR